jgi:hypothetical protein
MACAAKDVSGVRGTDVFVTAGRIVELQGLKIGWRMGAVADAVRSRMGSAPYFGCFRFCTCTAPPDATIQGGSNAANKASMLAAQAKGGSVHFA